MLSYMSIMLAYRPESHGYAGFGGSYPYIDLYIRMCGKDRTEHKDVRTYLELRQPEKIIPTNSLDDILVLWPGCPRHASLLQYEDVAQWSRAIHRAVGQWYSTKIEGCAVRAPKLRVF